MDAVASKNTRRFFFIASSRFAVIEFVYVAKRVIFPIYLGDAAIELILIGWWILDIAVF